MKFGLGVNANEPLRDIVKKSIAAETFRMDYLWVSDSPVQLYAPIVASAVASETSKIRIGLGLMSPFLYTPDQIASAITTLSDTHGNRFDLCIGVGDRRQLSRVGIRTTNIRELPFKVLEAKRRIVSHLNDAGVRAKIWLGAQGPKMLGIANSFDGVLLNYSKPEMLEWAIKKAGLRRRPRLAIGTYSPSYVHLKSDPSVLRMAKVSSAVVALGTAGPILKDFGLYEKIRKVRKIADASPTFESILEAVPDDVIKAFSVTMKASNLHGYLTELKRLGVSHVVFAYPQNHSLTTIRELARALNLNY
jgi:hypothetical protein